MLRTKFGGGLLDGSAIEGGFLKLAEGGGKRIGGLFGKSEAVLPWFDEVGAATVSKGDNWAAGSESFDGGDAERFKTGEKVDLSALEILGQLVRFGPGEEFDQRRVISDF